MTKALRENSKKFLNIFAIDKTDILIGLLAVGALLAFIPVFTYAIFARDLASTEGIMNRNDTGVIILDSKDRPFFSFYSGRYKEFTPLSTVPTYTKEAIIAAEDKDFYTHPGFSPKAIVGAVIADIKHQQLAYGGSTITQQLVKNSLLTSEKSFLRKYQELVLSQEIERRYTKDEILEMYLNSVYFGEGSFGVYDASKTYFGKEVKDLSLPESSFLATILNAPSRYSPFSGNLEIARVRQRYVLQSMVEKRFITQEQADQAFDTELQFVNGNKDINSKAPHFALMVKDELIKKYGEERISRSGFKVKTTIDLDWQEYAEGVVANQVEKLKTNNVSNGAAVVMDPKNGEIKALVGSKDWYEPNFGKFNIITSERPPGSSFKPIVYADALEKKILTPASVLHDSPITYKGNVEASKAPKGDGSPEYKPLDYDKKFRGQVLLRRALSNSLNIPSVEIMAKLGVPEVVEYAQKLGISSLQDPSNYGLSLVLGAGEVKPLELTGAYAVFANGGEYHEPTTIEQIEDKSGHIVYTHEAKGEKVMESGVAYQIASILSEPTFRKEMFGNALDNKVMAAVKTGTTESYKDAWTMGFTDSVVVGVWVGNNDNTPMDQVAGSLGAAPIFISLVEKFSNGPSQFIKPDSIVNLGICKSNGLLVKGATSSAFTEHFLKGTEPTKNCVITPPSPSPSVSPNPADVVSEDERKRQAEEQKRQEEEAKKQTEKAKNDNNGKKNSTQVIEFEGGTVTIQTNQN